MIAGAPMPPNGAVLAAPVSGLFQLQSPPVPPATVDRIFPARGKQTAREAEASVIRHSNRFIEIS